MFKYIDKIGLEFEGGWIKYRNDLIEEGSLRQAEFPGCDSYGELVSEPLNSLDECYNFINKHWPDIVVKRCGFHIHFSLKNINYYGKCMSPKFYHKYFLPDIAAWANDYPIRNDFFWERYNNLNEFCRRDFIPEQQVVVKKKTGNDVDVKAVRKLRYCHLFFAYGMHKTIECRLFPMFVNKETGKSALKALVDCVERFLDENPPVEHRGITVIDENNNEEKVINDKIEISFTEKKLKLRPFNYFNSNPFNQINNNSKTIEKPNPNKIKQRKISGILNNSPVTLMEALYGVKKIDQEIFNNLINFEQKPY